MMTEPDRVSTPQREPPPRRGDVGPSPLQADFGIAHRRHAAVAQARIGIAFTASFGALYALFGSPWSGAAILLVFGGLLCVPGALRRDVPTVWIGNGLIGATWLATFVVASRTGGFSSPAVVWSFLFPLATYAVCGRRSALVWAALSGVQVGAFFVADLAGIEFAQDFSPRMLSILRVSGYAGVIATIILLLSVIEAARRAAFDVIHAERRAKERARILNDMHDGVGSHLLGLIIQLRGGAVETPKIVASLETCIDDLRLIVASLDAAELDLAHALGDLRVRVEPRFTAAGIGLQWDVEVAFPRADGAAVMQCLRALQEMLTNALRHSGSSRVEVKVRLQGGVSTAIIEVEVRDHGRGFDPSVNRPGRGLTSLRSRARGLGGTFALERADPGVLARFRVPMTAVVDDRTTAAGHA
jgi:signal transduction histidine kinase